MSSENSEKTDQLSESHKSVGRFAAYLREAGRQPSTVDSYGRDARFFVSYLNSQGLAISQVEPATLVAFEEYLRTEKMERENSVRRSVIGVRLFYRYLVESAVIRSTPFDEVPIPQRTEDLPAALSTLDFPTLLEAAMSEPSPLRKNRNRVISCLLALEGLKASELIELKWKDVLDFSSGMTLQVHGLRKRVIVVCEESRDAICEYRPVLALALGLENEAALATSDSRVMVAFQGRDGGTIHPHMTRHGIKFVIYELGEKLGLPHLNSEVLRHYAVTNLLSLGKSVEDIKIHLGLRRAGNITKHVAGNHPQQLVSGLI